MTDRETTTVRAADLRTGDYILHQGELCMVSTRRPTEIGDGLHFVIGPRKGSAMAFDVPLDHPVERVYAWPDGPPPPPKATKRGRR